MYQRFLHLINKAINKPKCLSSSTAACLTLLLQGSCFDWQDPSRYFGCELGAQTQFEVKKVSFSMDLMKQTERHDG